MRQLICIFVAVLFLIGGSTAFVLGRCFENERKQKNEDEKQCVEMVQVDPYVLEVQIPPDVSVPEVATVGRYETIQEQITDEDRALSALMIYHESRGEPEEGQRAVAEVLCNRILSDLYPGTAKEVIYQPNQFACADALTTVAVREPACLTRAFDVLHQVLEETEYVLPETYLYFGTSLPSNAKSYVQIGNHYFYEI